MAQMDSSPAYSERDLKICFSILKHLQSQLDSDTVPKELRESLEGENVLFILIDLDVFDRVLRVKRISDPLESNKTGVLF